MGVDAQPSPLTLSPGRYRLDERVPHSRRGRWRLDDVVCDGQVLPNPEEAEVTITDGAGATCTFVNSFEASGEIQIEKVTLGGVTTTGFVIWPVGDPETRYRKVATTERSGEPARAKGSDTDALPLGAYVIQELEPASPAGRNWSLVEVLCNGRTLPAIEGRVVVRLTRDQPLERCRFINSIVDVPVPIEPPGPGSHSGRPGPQSRGEQDRRPAKGLGRRGGQLQGHGQQRRRCHRRGRGGGGRRVRGRKPGLGARETDRLPDRAAFCTAGSPAFGPAAASPRRSACA